MTLSCHDVYKFFGYLFTIQLLYVVDIKHPSIRVVGRTKVLSSFAISSLPSPQPL